MLIRNGDCTYLEARAKVEPAESVITADYYTQLSQIRLTGSSTDRPMQQAALTEVTLDENDVTKLVECAVTHPTPNMRYAVLTAIWNHPDSFRQILQFGLEAPLALPEIRKIVAEELAKCSPTTEAPASNQAKPAVETLLPAMPLPAHLRDRDRQ